MVKTNLDNLKSEIAEVVNEFGDNLDIELNAEIQENNMKIAVLFNGNLFSYEYKLNYKNELERKRFVKRFAKLSAYKSLSENLKINLPWGALTGIRPTKLAYSAGKNWKEFFVNDMFVSQNKADIIEEILAVQKPYMLSGGTVDDLFISVPFCPSRCSYCSFLSCEIGREKHINEYIEALIKEIEHALSLGKKYRSVYIGGGTPVSLTDENFERILKAVGKVEGEYTIEAGRPDAITEEKLEIMKAYGVTRVCVNPQTFLDKTLNLIGRKHTAKDIEEKFALVKKFGFIINMDLIAGLPEESYEDFKFSLDKAISLNPENITVHTLCLKKGSKLKESVDRLNVSDIEKMVEYSHEKLKYCGYKPYYLYRQKYMAGNLENTGYCKDGAACIYNIDIMEEIGNIVACGANAVSKRVFGNENRIERYGSPKDIVTYINKVDEIILQKTNLLL